MTNGKATTHDLSTTTNLQSNPFNARAKFHAAVHVREHPPGYSPALSTHLLPV